MACNPILLATGNTAYQACNSSSFDTLYIDSIGFTLTSSLYTDNGCTTLVPDLYFKYTGGTQVIWGQTTGGKGIIGFTGTCSSVSTYGFQDCCNSANTFNSIVIGGELFENEIWYLETDVFTGCATVLTSVIVGPTYTATSATNYVDCPTCISDNSITCFSGCTNPYYCLNTNRELPYDATYSIAGPLYNGYDYYVSNDIPTVGFIFFDGIKWCLSSSLGGTCILFGKTPCNSACPDLCDELIAGDCATTTTTTNACDVFDFEALLNCDVTPTQTVTPTYTLTPTPTPTLTPTVTINCAGTSISLTSTILPTSTPTPTPTPSPTNPIRNLCFTGEATFNIFDANFVCTTTKKLVNCNTQEIYYINENLIFSGVPIETGVTFSANINKEEVCVTYSGSSISSSNATLNSINVIYGLGCDDCLNPTPTPTPTQSVTPTATLTPTPTRTPTATLPLEIFRMSASTLSAITITNLESVSYPFIVNWGDGNSDTYSAGSHTPTHIYNSLFTGVITVSSQHLSDIQYFSITNTLTGTSSPLITISTSEYTKLSSILTSSLGSNVLLVGQVSQIPRDLYYLLITKSNITGSTYNLPTGLTNCQLYNNNGGTIISGNTLGLPTGLTYFAIYDNTISGNTSGLPTGLTVCDIEGDNTISGDTADIPPLIYNLTIGGNNTIGGDTSGLPTGLTYCHILGDNTISGDTSGLPTGLTNIQITGNNTISGDTLGLPLGLITSLYISGNNTIGGDVSNLPSGLIEIYLLGSGTTAGTYITGNVSSLPIGLTNCTILGYNEIDGSFSDFPTNLTNINIQGNNTITGYTSSHVWPTTMKQLTVIGNATVNTTNINNILSDLATYSTTWTGSSKFIKLKGTSTNSAAELILTGRGVIITINP